MISLWRVIEQALTSWKSFQLHWCFTYARKLFFAPPSPNISWPQNFIFRWPCISLQFFANDQLDALFYIFIYYTSLHVSSITVLIIRRSNCINTSSGMISLCEWLLGMPDRHTKRSLTQTNHTRWCINTIKKVRQVGH